MTKPRRANPQPSTDPPKGPRQSIYLWPKSKDPQIQRIYDWLEAAHWRFDAVHMLWHTPEKDALQGFGSLEHAPDGSWFRIQPPNVEPLQREEPLLVCEFQAGAYNEFIDKGRTA